MINTKVLIIGAGIGQRPLCEMIKESGYTLIVVTIPGDYPCIPLADKVYYIDIYEKEQIAEIAKNEKVDAVLSDQNDLMMPTVAYVAETLNLPGNTYNQVISYCNKNIFRRYCDILNIPSPKHISVTSIEFPKSFEVVPFPWIVKPEDSQSSIGVTKVNDKKEYFDAIQLALDKSKNKTAIVEEFFTGDEIVAEGFIYNGKYYNLGLADRRYFNLKNIFIPSQTIFPSTISDDIKKKIISYESSYANFVHPNFAIVHSEYLVNRQTEEIRVVESAVRGGGVYISSHLIPLYTDININKVLLDYSLGNNPAIEKILSHINNKASAYICFTLPKGIVISKEGINIVNNLPFVHKCDIFIQINDIVDTMTYKGQRLGPIIISGQTRLEVEEHINYIKSILKIQVKNSNNDIQNIIW